MEEKPENYDDMIAAGYEMTADGFWIPAEDKPIDDEIMNSPAAPVKLILLESGETLIAEVAYSMDGANLILDDPRTVIIQAYRLDDEEKSTSTTISYSDWMPLASERKFTLSSKYVVLVTDPIDSLIESYTRARENG